MPLDSEEPRLASEAAADRAGSTIATGSEPHSPSERPAPEKLTESIGLGIVLVVGGALLGARLYNGWVPHDEGVLGQSAERVLLGQLPHKDFDEIYTGLLSYLNALAFKVQGIGSQTMRMPLFVAALLWQATIYRIAVRFMPPLGAALVTLLALVWSVPNYPAALPSWYNLFCATWALLAVIRWIEDGRTRWLVLAGVAGGVSFLFKLTGAFSTVGGAFAIAAITTSRRSGVARSDDLKYANAVVTIAFLGLALVLLLVMARAGQPAVVRFAAPITVLAVAFAVREWRQSGGTAFERIHDLGAAVFPLLLGAALPIALFLGWSAAHGGLSNLVEGVFITPFQRVTFARYPPPAPLAVLAALPMAWFFWPRQNAGGKRWIWTAAVSAIPLTMLLLLSAGNPSYYLAVWRSAWSLPFLVALIGAMSALGYSGVFRTLGGQQRNVLIATCVTAVFAVLVEFPFAAPIYTMYALPLSIMAVAVSLRMVGRTPPALQYVMLAFFLTFGVFRVMSNRIPFIGERYVAKNETALLNLSRGRLWIHPAQAREYEAVVSVIQQRALGRVMWAGPDSPEIYFLSGMQNPTRTMFDFFDPIPSHVTLAQHVEALGAGIIVLNLHPEFSPRLSSETISELAAAYPHYQLLDRFLVMWQ